MGDGWPQALGPSWDKGFFSFLRGVGEDGKDHAVIESTQNHLGA